MRNYPVIVTLVLLTLPFVAFGKHPAPPQVGAVTNSGVRYAFPNDKGLRAYVEAWDVQTGKKLWAKTIVRHHYIPPFGTECMHYEYLMSIALQNGTLILTSDRGRTYSLDTRTRAVRRVKTREPNRSVERTGASRSARLQFVSQWRLAPAAHAGCCMAELNRQDPWLLCSI
jgi:hypothetical protein